MAQLNKCPHCGSETEFIVQMQGVMETVLAQCKNCKIQTQPLASSLDYSAKARSRSFGTPTTPRSGPHGRA